MDRSLEDNMPIYMQIMNRIRDAIASGELAAGDKVPSVREFASEFEVNPNTMQRALMELEREGILVSERAIGRFVTDDRSRIDAMQAQGQRMLLSDRWRTLAFQRRKCWIFFVKDMEKR